MFAQLLEALEKAVTTGNITAVVPEDLEVEAHNTLWTEASPEELTLLKMIPAVKAKQIRHEYARITSYGFDGNTGFFGETSLPPETNFGSDRVVNNIRLMGEIGPTFLLASLEETVQALGTSGAENIEREAIRLNVLKKMNRNLYNSRTDVLRLGAGGLRYKGIEQLIEEGTDGTTGTSIYGSHVIDMEGSPLNVDTIRDKMGKAATLFGVPNLLMMDPLVRSDFEGTLDGAQRLNLPIQASPYMIGQLIGGIQSQNGVLRFMTDNTLSPIYSRPKYRTDLVEGAPTTIPALVSIAAGAPGGGEVSKWDAASDGNIFYMITETVNEREGLGRRAPATSYTAITPGQKMTIHVTPGNPTADSFKVYRGNDSSTDAWFVFEVANSGGGGDVTITDLNDERPNTSRAFALRIDSDSARALMAPRPDAFEYAKSMADKFFRQPDRKQNTVSVANLGPPMGILNLAAVLAQVSRPLVYSAHSPQVKNAFQNFVFKNIGRA